MTYSKSLFRIRLELFAQFKNGTITPIVEVTSPKSRRLGYEIILEVKVPVFVFIVKLELIFATHVSNCEDSIIFHVRVVLDCFDSKWYHLLKMMHFIDILMLTPESSWLVNEDDIFIFVINHF